MRRFVHVTLCVLTLACAPALASAATLDFDDLADGTPVATYGGQTFTNALALQAGVSLNEIEFPPASGSVVLLDSGGPLRVDFASGVRSVSARVNYGVQMTLQVFNASNVQVGSATSLFSSNLALSGDSGSAPNEVLGVTLASFDIAYAVFTGDSLGTSFTLDDLTFEPRQSVPEPTTLALLACGLGYVASRRR